MTDPRLDLLARAGDLLNKAAGHSAERSWRKNLLESLTATTRRIRRKIEDDPEDEVIEPHRGPNSERSDDPWSEFRIRGGQ